MDKFAISLFSGSGIGDIGFRKAGIEFLSFCEIERDRAALLKANFPDSKLFSEDIASSKNEIINHTLNSIGNTKLFLLTCTAPCQGMSSNGMGTLLKLVREGKRPKLDPRNRLILHALDIAEELLPEWIVFENVVGMKNTIIENENYELENILHIIERRLTGYVGMAYEVNVADYGVPQHRKRLITVYTRNENAKKYFDTGVPLIPDSTHSEFGGKGKKKWVSVFEALKDFPPLDSKDSSKATSDIPFHRVSVLDPKKYFWIENTPPRCSAFDNQCINPECKYNKNPSHFARHDAEGINRASKKTPLYCERCNSLLPRPWVEEKDGSKRIMSGYTSAYRRMDPDKPATALTRNFSFPCSDKKVHYEQNRVLTIAEALVLQTISDYSYIWGPLYIEKNGSSVLKKCAPDTLIRLVIAESVPPRFFEFLARYIIDISNSKVANLNGIPKKQLALPGI